MAVHASLRNSILQLDGALDVLLLEGASALAPEGELVVVACASPSEVCLEVVIRGLAGGVVCSTVASRTPVRLAVGLAVVKRCRETTPVTAGLQAISMPVVTLIVIVILYISFPVNLISFTRQPRAEWGRVFV